jgi:hypothetical protein
MLQIEGFILQALCRILIDAVFTKPLAPHNVQHMTDEK